MLRSHEPSRLVSPDRQQCDIQIRVPRCRTLEVSSTAEACIAGEVEGFASRADDEGGPERVVAVSCSSGRPVMRLLGMHLETGSGFEAFAPVHRGDGDFRIVSTDDGVVAKRGYDLRAVPHPKGVDGGQVQVIIVIVRDEDQIDARKMVERDTRRIVTSGTREGDRARPLGPDRIGQDVVSTHLNKECRVADEADAQILLCNAGWGRI